MDRQILLRLNIDELIHFTQTSSKVQQLVSDASFWKMKMDYEDLPFLTKDFNKNFKEWVEEYIKIQHIVITVNEILKIHEIESLRRYDPLKLIILPLVSDFIVSNLFNVEVYEKFQTNYDQVNILIELKKNYKLMLEGLQYGNIRNVIEIDNINQDIIYDILINSIYLYPNIEILDQLSINFILPYNMNIDGFNEEDKRIINKRFGIRDGLYY